MLGIPLGDMLIRLTGDSTSFEKMVAAAESKISAAGARLEALGTKMTQAVTLPLLALGVASVKTFSDFDDAMTKSTAIMGNISAEMRGELEKTARELSTRSVTGAAKLAEAYYFLASAGLTATQAMAALPVVEAFATAGAFDMATATDLLADAQSSLGLASKDTVVHITNMTRLSDVLTKGGIIANASVEQLAKSLTTKAAPAMRFLNMDVEEGVAILAAYAAQGVKGEQAGEKFDILLRELQNSVSTNSEAWSKLGLSVYDANGKIRPVVDILGQLEKTFAPMTDEQKQATTAMLGFRSESFSAIRPLLGMTDAVRAYEAELRLAGGATQDVAERQLKSFASQATILKNNLQDVMLEIGQELVPMLKMAGKWIQEWIVWWRSLSMESKRLVISLGVVAAAIGPVLVLLGMLTTAVSTLIGVVTALTLRAALLAGVWLVVITALALTLDGILQLTGQGNLGMIDLIQSSKVAGFQISTYMTSAWLEVFKAFAWMEAGIEHGWTRMADGAQLAGRAIYRGFLAAFRELVVAFIKVQDFLTFGAFSSQFASNIAGVQMLFNEEIDASLDKAAESHREYIDKLKKNDAEYLEYKKSIDKEIEDLFGADDANARAQAGAAQRAADSTNTLTMPELVLPTIPEVVIPPETKLELPDIDSKRGNENQEFGTTSLRRFSLDPLAGSQVRKKEKQEVHAPDVVKAVHDQTKVLQAFANRYGTVPAVLG